MRKLGKTQRLVLENVLAGLEPNAGNKTYAEYTRRQSVAFDLLKRGFLELKSHVHPDVIAGRPQWRITDEGLKALSS